MNWEILGSSLKPAEVSGKENEAKEKREQIQLQIQTQNERKLLKQNDKSQKCAKKCSWEAHCVVKQKCGFVLNLATFLWSWRCYNSFKSETHICPFVLKFTCQLHVVEWDDDEKMHHILSLAWSDDTKGNTCKLSSYPAATRYCHDFWMTAFKVLRQKDWQLMLTCLMR